MACGTLEGRLLRCADAIGGIMTAFFIEYGTIEPVFEVGKNIVTSLGAGVTAYEWDIKSASNMIQTVPADVNSGTTVVQQAVTAIFQKLDEETEQSLLALAYGNPHVVIQLRDGRAILLGLDRGCKASNTVADSGTAATDLQGYTVSLTGEERIYAPWIKGSTPSNVFGDMTDPVTVVKGTEPVPV